MAVHISLKKTISKYLNSLCNVVYPPYCILCQSKLRVSKDFICDDCWYALPRFPDSQNIVDEVIEKLRVPVHLTAIYALWEFKGEVRLIVHRLKYNHHRCLAEKIGSFMANFIALENKLSKADVLIPVPLHKRRQRRRGYNQSSIICQPISKMMGLPMDDCSLRRIKHTQSQTRLNATQRLCNVADAFRIIDQSNIEGKRVVLIDDVITTGATINACAQELERNGAKEIFALSIAKA